jgi:hypothetical protein
MLRVIMLRVTMLRVIMLRVIMLRSDHTAEPISLWSNIL